VHSPADHRRRPFRWRATLIWLHRDVGFFCLGLTVVYAVSGIAVNHRGDWDYNHRIEERVFDVGPPEALLAERGLLIASELPSEPGEVARQHQGALVDALLARLQRETPPRKVFWRGPNRLSLFFAEGERDIVDYLPQQGRAEWTVKTPRPIIRPFNILHLNELRQSWTWMADTYAVLLLFLAVSGMLMVKGKKGLLGRGGLLAAAGIAIPVIVLLLA
jgi:hypothetical protein